MEQENDTQQLIASAFQKLTTKKAIDKITITDIMKQAGFRRQTFYDYFDDRYDLVTWIFYWELYESIYPKMTWENWENILYHLLTYLESNKSYYKKIFLNIKLDSFKQYFIYLINKVVNELINDYFRGHSLSQDKKQLIQVATDFYNYGLSESLYHWVLENCETSSQNYHEMLVKLVKYHLQVD